MPLLSATSFNSGSDRLIILYCRHKKIFFTLSTTLVAYWLWAIQTIGGHFADFEHVKNFYRIF